MDSKEDIILWFDEFHRKQLEEIREAKKKWWNSNQTETEKDLFIYTK